MARALQTEMFEVVAYDPPLRDQRDVMEYPFLSIQKGRTKPIVFSDDRRDRSKPGRVPRGLKRLIEGDT